MRKLIFLFVLLLPAGLLQARSPQDTVLQELKAQIDALKADYEKKIADLQSQVEQLQVQMLQAPGPETAAEQAPAATQSIPGALNPAISVIGNFVGRADDQDVFNDAGDRISDKMNLREAEIDMRVAVDPYADGALIVSAESEFPGQFETGVEEGYVNIKKLPFLDHQPLGLKLKVGRFRPLFGKINILHTHDLPSMFRPLPIEEFLGEEGFVQNGLSASFYIPSPWDPSGSLDAAIEVMDGGDIAISPQAESRISYLGHVRYFHTFADAHNVELGWSSYYHPSGDDVGTANVNGLDFLYRWKPLRQGEWKSYLLGAEVMFAPKTTVEAELATAQNLSTPVGFTVFNQWQFDRRLYAGLRYDQTDTLLNSDLHRRSITPYVSYYFSEFLRFRVNYEHRWSDLVEEDGRNSLFVEVNWLFGSHPPEPFWVNK